MTVKFSSPQWLVFVVEFHIPRKSYLRKATIPTEPFLLTESLPDLQRIAFIGVP